MISVMPISPDNNDQGADGHEPAVDVEGGQDGRHAVGDDQDMPDMMPTGAESEQEADARRARIAERLGTEAEWEGIVAPPVPDDPAGFARPPRGERIRPVAKPVALSRREREFHELCHYPYASWCKRCVKGKATNDLHRKLKKHAWRESEPVVSGDFCFLGQSEENNTAPVFVMRDHRSRVTFAHVTQGKSTNKEVYSQYLTKSAVADLVALGHNRIILKTDQEPAMVALQECVKAASNVEMIIRNSPVGESQSNGVVEKAVRDIEDQVRTLKDAAESRMNIRIGVKSPLPAWLVEHAAWLYNNCVCSCVSVLVCSCVSVLVCECVSV